MPGTRPTKIALLCSVAGTEPGARNAVENAKSLLGGIGLQGHVQHVSDGHCSERWQSQRLAREPCR